MNLPPCRGSFLLESHDQVQNFPGARTTVNDVTYADKVGLAAGPSKIAVDQASPCQNRNEFTIGAMYITNGNNPFDPTPLPLSGMRGRRNLEQQYPNHE
jgi:hypothetical protein